MDVKLWAIEMWYMEMWNIADSDRNNTFCSCIVSLM